jgi:hypothetical protein
MRVFLCSFGNFSLAIPIYNISSVILIPENQERPVEYNDEYNNTYLSLPLLFNLPLERVKHGIILKRSDDGGADDDIKETRNILLTTEINCETEIPEDQIYSMPKILKLECFISGIVFACTKTSDTTDSASKTDLILLVNPVRLFESVKRNRE